MKKDTCLIPREFALLLLHRLGLASGLGLIAAEPPDAPK